MAKRAGESVTIGLRAKTGRAIAVALAGSADSPRLIKRLELTLCDPAIPATYQPYHEVLAIPWDRARAAVRKTAAIIERIATRELAGLIKELLSEGLKVHGVGIVGAGERNLERIGSTHIRAHAAEGVLFRQVLEVAATSNKLPNRRMDERSLDEQAVSELNLSLAEIKAQLAEMGRSAGSPWRADEKAAATAAWLVLADTGK